MQDKGRDRSGRAGIGHRDLHESIRMDNTLVGPEQTISSIAGTNPVT
jgi:hypothetical protein